MRIHAVAGRMTSAAVLCLAGAVSAQQAPPNQYVFPANGQSPEQQQVDEATCSAWATQQTGFTPGAPPPAPTPQPTPPAQKKAGLRGAVRGAAAGYIVGDIANDEGDATICTPAGCHEASLDALDVPRLIRLDLEQGVMHAVTPQHSGRRSHFKVIERGETTLVLQGYENGRAFSAVLDEPGTLAISASTGETNFSVFARCTDLRLVTEVGK
ncbi:MAG TPA: hypothetical protein VLT81_03480 [Chondromyces sp.]|nr:hypothetical protein [Chondromyces sp.]